MRILLLTCARPQPGGVYSYVNTLAAGLAGRGHAVSIHTPLASGRTAAFARGPLGHAAAASSGQGVLADGLYWWAKQRLRQNVSAHRWLSGAVWHAHDAAAALCTPVGTPLVLTVHGFLAEERVPTSEGGHLAAWRRARWLADERAGYLRATRIVSNFPQLADHVHSLAPEAGEPKLIANAVDANRFRPNADARPDLRRRLGILDGECLLLCPSRPYRRKGLDLVLRAVATLPTEWRQQVRLLSLGLGPARRELQRLAVSLGLGAQVLWRQASDHEEMPGFYQAADVVAIPSIAWGKWVEGPSLAALEAMSSEVLVVASDLGGLRSLITSGKDGVLFPPGEPQSLALVLRRYLEAPAAFTPLRQAARQTVCSRFALDHQVDRYLEIYRQVLDHHACPTS